jgi:WD40 repeat protein/transcriptional regulator with XRE-family HTH domain
VKKSSYGERDYAFGLRMLRLRTGIGLTQAGLAGRLRISRQALGEWESGSSYPKAEHLKYVIALGVHQQAFVAGHEEEDIRALWSAAHQKVLLDEPWLQELLSQQASPLVPAPVEQIRSADRVSAPPAARGPRVDWGDALDVPTFYGREEELALLSRWVVQEHCRVVSVLGMGGIGKSALAVTLMHRVAAHFEVVIWRSLRDAPGSSALVEECLQVLAPQPLRDISASLEGRLHLLMEQMRELRVLLVLDNLEMLLEEGTGTGLMRAGFEGYARLLRRMGETAHQSCLLLTSREKPADLVPLEGSRSPVRALRLAGLNGRAGAQLLAEKDVVSSPHDRVRLVEVYRGNPLALKIVAQTIVELFGGEIVPFLEQGEVVFGGVRELLREQFDRLADLEQTLLCWLAIVREPVTLGELRAMLVMPRHSGELLEAVEGLRQRSLIERGQHPGSFTLQPVVLEYVTTRLVAEVSGEIAQGGLARLIQHGLSQAHTRDYVRRTQERLLLAPVLARLHSVRLGPAQVDELLRSLLDHLRQRALEAQGYGPANLVALLHLLRGNLRGLDLSHLSLRGVSLQGIEMQDTTLAGSLIQEAVFTEAFDAINGVAISSNGEYWAASSRRGEVRVWEAGGQTLHRIWQAHTERAWSLAFSPDGRMLASGSWDGLVKLWEVTSGMLVWSGRHTGNINSVAFAPDGSMLASGGAHETILWDVKSGTQAQTLTHPDQVIAVEWSPQGHLLATGDVEGSIRLWSVHKTELAICILTLTGHTKLISDLAFAPDGSTLASASYDSTIKLWDVAAGRLHQTLTGHTERVHRVTWSPNGRLLASGGYEKMIWLWDVEQNRYRGTLQGHTDSVIALAFTPDSRSLLSSGDSTLRLWDIASGRSIRVLQGNVGALFDVDWSPDGTHLVSGGSDKLVTISDAIDGTSSNVLRGHGGLVFGVGWSPDGMRLASSSWDTTIRLWDPATGINLQVLRASDDPITFFCGVAWSPDGQRLAGTTYLNLPGVLVWDVIVDSHLWQSLGYPTPIRRVAWSPDGTWLAGGGDNGELYVWNANDGTLLQRLSGHQGPIKSVAWSPDGTRLVSAGRGRESGELIVWDAQRGERMHTIVGHPGIIYAVAWGMNGELGDMLVSGGSDGTLRWWIVNSGECLWVREAHQGTVQSLRRSPDGTKLASCGDDGAIMLWDLHRGEHLQTLRRDRPYERLNITGIRGLSAAQKASLHALGAFEETSVGE